MLKEGEQRLDGVLVPSEETAQRPVVFTPRAGLPLGPVEPFAEFLERRVSIVDLEELGPTSRQLVERQAELSGLIAPLLWKRLPHLSLEEVMTIAGIQLAELSETRAYQEILAMGLEHGGAGGPGGGADRFRFVSRSHHLAGGAPRVDTDFGDTH